MLQTDERIVEILLKHKKEGNKLLQHFHISYPSNKVAQASNSIFVAVADYESSNNGFDFDRGTDLVDILVVTKKHDNQKDKKHDDTVYSESKFIIKMVMREIRRILRLQSSVEILEGEVVFRNLTPEYNPNYVLNRGHMLVQLPVIDSFDDYEEDIERVCDILIGEVDYV